MALEIHFYNRSKLFARITGEKGVTHSCDIGNGLSSRKPDIILPFPGISRNHATLRMGEQAAEIMDNGSTNGTFINGKKILPGHPTQLRMGDVVTFSTANDIQAQLSINEDTDQPGNTLYNGTPLSTERLFEHKTTITIGRAGTCDLILDSKKVSRQHASIEKKSDRYYIADLGSKNGTFVNGRKIGHRQEISNEDTILIGSYRLSLQAPPVDIRNETAIKLSEVSKVVKGGKTILHPTNISFPSHTFISIMGPSGCGKSTLLKAITGESPPSGGSILIHGLDLFDHYNYLKSYIGYVPQDDIIHYNLTVHQCLYFAAKLRIEKSDEDYINSRISDVLQKLNISETKDSIISSLSGGQRKRVSIAVELLNDPFILFLDEPTSPLDPQSVEEFLVILKNLTNSGTTVIMVTHKPDDLNYSDSILFLGTGGYPLFFGRVNTLCSYFEVEKPVQIYQKISASSHAAIEQLYRNFLASHSNPASETYTPEKVSNKRSFGLMRQLYWLTLRYLKIKINDSVSTWILLLQAPIIALLIVLIFNKVVLALLFLMSITAVWLGTNNAAREIVSENSVYRRERMYNLSISTYIGSKMIVLCGFAMIQSLVFVGIIFLNFANSEIPIESFYYSTIWFWGLNMISTMLGLFLSALSKTSDQVVNMVPIVLIPQIMLAGVLMNIRNTGVEFLSYLTITRWGTEGFTLLQKKVGAEIHVLDQLTGNLNKQNTIEPAHRLLSSQFHQEYVSKNIFGHLTGTLELDLVTLATIGIVLCLTTLALLRRKDAI